MTGKFIIAIHGGGDLGSATALRLVRCGFRVIISEQPQPTAVRRTVAFSEAVYEGSCAVEQVEGQLIHSSGEAALAWANGIVPVLVDPGLRIAMTLRPAVVVDARLRKRSGIAGSGYGGSIGLGPGFAAGKDVSAVVETNRGPSLGRVIWEGRAEANTSMPAEVQGRTKDRVLRAPVSGIFTADATIGQTIHTGETAGHVGQAPIFAGFDGMVRGLLRSGTPVSPGMKVGDLDPRFNPLLCQRVSDKALAVAGGAVEAILILLRNCEGD